MSFVEVTFVNHCVRIYSNTRNLSMEDTVDLFSKRDAIDGYLVPRFEIFHEQDAKQWYASIQEYLDENVLESGEVSDKNLPLIDLLGSRLIKNLIAKFDISLTDAMLFYYNSNVYSQVIAEDTNYRLSGMLKITRDLVEEYSVKGE